MATWGTIAVVLAGIVLIGEAGAAIYKLIRPVINVKKDVEELKEHDRKDYEALVKIQELNKSQCLCMIDIMNHMIDGNHVEAMKDTRDDALRLLGKS